MSDPKICDLCGAQIWSATTYEYGEHVCPETEGGSAMRTQ